MAVVEVEGEGAEGRHDPQSAEVPGTLGPQLVAAEVACGGWDLTGIQFKDKSKKTKHSIIREVFMSIYI